MEKRTLVCVAGNHSGGGVDAITVDYVGGVCVGLVLGRYDQIPYFELINSPSSPISWLDLLYHRKY